MSQSIEVEDTGYDAFSELLEKYSISDEKALDAVESGAQEFKDDCQGHEARSINRDIRTWLIRLLWNEKTE